MGGPERLEAGVVERVGWRGRQAEVVCARVVAVRLGPIDQRREGPPDKRRVVWEARMFVRDAYLEWPRRVLLVPEARHAHDAAKVDDRVGVTEGLGDAPLHAFKLLVRQAIHEPVGLVVPGRTL